MRAMDFRQRRRVVAISLSFLAAAALIVAAFAQRWLVDPDHPETLSLGLRTAEICEEGACVALSTSEVIDYVNAKIDKVVAYNKTVPPSSQVAVPRRPWDGFPVVGWIAFVASLIAAAGLFVGAVLALAGKRYELPIMPTTFAVLGIAIAIVNVALYMAMHPSVLITMTIGWSFPVYGFGAIAGLGAAFPLNRQIRPIDPELGAASATMSWGGSRDDQP